MTGRLLRGVDIASFQGKKSVADLKAWKAQWGLDFIAVRCVRETMDVDTAFRTDWANAHQVGFDFYIAYAFGNDRHAATAGADLLVSTMDAGPRDLPCLDLERSVLNQAKTNDWAATFGNRLRSRLPHNPNLLYMGGGYAANNSGKGLAKHFTHWWLPEYPAGPAWPATFDPAVTKAMKTNTGWADGPAFWQFYGTNVDRDVCRLSAAQVLGTDPAPAPQGEDVPSRDSFVLTKPVGLQTGANTVGWDTEVGDPDNFHTPGMPSVLTGPAQYNADYQLFLTGLSTGQVYEVRVHEKAKDASGSWVVDTTPFDDAFTALPDVNGVTTKAVSVVGGYLPSTQHLHLEIAVPVGCALGAGSTCQVQYWKG